MSTYEDLPYPDCEGPGPHSEKPYYTPNNVKISAEFSLLCQNCLDKISKRGGQVLQWPPPRD